MLRAELFNNKELKIFSSEGELIDFIVSDDKEKIENYLKIYNIKKEDIIFYGKKFKKRSSTTEGGKNGK